MSTLRRILSRRPAVRLAAAWAPVLALSPLSSGSRAGARAAEGPRERSVRPAQGASAQTVSLTPVRSPWTLVGAAQGGSTEQVLDLTYVGDDEDGPLPAAVYNGIGQDGRIYRIAVSYVTPDGRHAAGEAGAAWLWLADGGQLATLTRRSDWDEAPAARQALDEALARALDAADQLDAALAAAADAVDAR